MASGASYRFAEKTRTRKILKLRLQLEFWIARLMTIQTIQTIQAIQIFLAEGVTRLTLGSHSWPRHGSCRCRISIWWATRLWCFQGDEDVQDGPQFYGFNGENDSPNSVVTLEISGLNGLNGIVEWIHEWMNEFSDWVTDWLTEWLTEWLTDSITEWTNQWVNGENSDWRASWRALKS